MASISPRLKKLLIEHKKLAYLSRELATIKTDLPLKFELEKCRANNFQLNKIRKIFQELGFRSLLDKIPLTAESQGQLPFNFQSSAEKQRKKNKNYILIDDQKKLQNFLQKIADAEIFALDAETDSVNPFKAKLLGISFSWQKGLAYFLPTSGAEFCPEKLIKILADPKIKKIGHNIKFDLQVFKKAGLNLAGIYFDTMIAAYLLNPGERRYNLNSLVFKEFGWQLQNIEELIGQGKKQISMAAVDLVKMSNYSCADSDYAFQLFLKLKPELKKKFLWPLLAEIEMPLISVLATMEKNGILINISCLKKMSRQVNKSLRDIDQKIYNLSGRQFNINSTQQLKKILFEKLAISAKGLKKTKTGISTAARELEKLKGRYKIIDLIFEHRELAKLKSTYIDALPKLIDPADGRLHTSFNQTIAATGRLSSSNPNLQNIPIRTDLGREIRKAFIAPPGFKLISADYSQIELRVAASLANDPAMISIFNRGEDIHSATASHIFNQDINKITFEQRCKAKEANFGVLYGLGARGLAERLRISYEEAQNFIDIYFANFKNLKQYLEETIALAHSLGWTETLFGRRRYFPEINVGSAMLAAQAERAAVNHPIQGTAADLIKQAMIVIQQQLPKISLKAKLLLQVHDELLLEAPNAEIKKISAFVQEAMSAIYKLKTPIEVKVSAGANWAEAH